MSIDVVIDSKQLKCSPILPADDLAFGVRLLRDDPTRLKGIIDS